MASGTVKIKVKLTGKPASDWSKEHKKVLAQMGVVAEPKGSDEEQGKTK